MKITSEPYGVLPTGETAMLYTLENNNGMSVSITNFGGTIIRLMVPDKNGKLDDVVLAHAGLNEYVNGNPGSFGATIGRSSNRIANAEITLDEGVFKLEANHFENNLHTGKKGLQFRLFDADVTSCEEDITLSLSCFVPHLDDGFPGNLDVHIAFTLTRDNALMLEYYAVSDEETVINLTNHTYFNLAGHMSGTVENHLLWCDASFYTPSAPPQAITTGEILSVKNTPLDFQTEIPVGPSIHSDFPVISGYNGIDLNLVLNGRGYRKVATLTDLSSGRVMHTYTDLPGVQIYTGNNLPTKVSEKDGAVYPQYGGICLETQTFPDGVNKSWFPSSVYGPEEEYISTTTYLFETL